MKNTYRLILCQVSLACLPALGLMAQDAAAREENAVTEESVKMNDGSPTPLLWLKNGKISVSFLPELGGKIANIRDAAGKEYLSRSKRPYVKRSMVENFGDTEFDGIDEIFPSMGKTAYPAGKLKGAEVPDHGELYLLEWKQIEGKGVVLEAESVSLKYKFRRQAVLEEDTLVLNYTVANLSDEPFHFTYAFHPLFAGEKGCRMDIPDDAAIIASWSKNGWLGERGEVKKWGSIKDSRGGYFKDSIFEPDSGRYYKFFSPKLNNGRFRLSYPGGTAVEISWPADKFPHYAVWCSEGGVDGLHHIAPEPTNSIVESLDKAYGAGETSVVPAVGNFTWQIRIRLCREQKTSQEANK